ncbi:hypothetical protein BX666DRAFT_2011290 [Dichotomocladium elegans]|nr:hypothetical protein BX666DRAFT_2011290 [Dichotomocladium elegans]
MLAARGFLQPMVLARTLFARNVTQCAKRSASTISTAADSALPSEIGLPFMFSKQMPEKHVSPMVTEYLAHLRPFSAPPAPMTCPTSTTIAEEGFQMTSVLRKRRLKMNKHKHKKLRKRTRALRKRLGK